MWMKNEFKLNPAVMIALSLTACGQNANIARPVEIKNASGQDASLKSESAKDARSAPAPAAESPAAPSPIPSASANPPVAVPVTPFHPVRPGFSPNPNSPFGSAPVIIPIPVPVLAPSPSPSMSKPVPVITGKAGRDGKNGRDGCGLRTTQIVTLAESMTEDEYDLKELPYRSTKLHKIPTRPIGSYSGKVGEFFYVRDTQIVFKFPVSLPPRDAVHHVSKAFIEMSLTKLSSDGHPDTEWLCFLDERICSGDHFDEKTWQANVNQDFWDHLNGNPTHSFVTQLNANRVGRVAGESLWGSEAFQLKIEDLIQHSHFKDVTDFLYAGLPSDRRVEHSYRMVVADDTYVHSAKLVIEIEENTCKTNELEQPESTHVEGE